MIAAEILALLKRPVIITGRVRARNGKVVAIVDEDKHAQYVANKPKVEWMTKALETVRG